MLISFLLPTRDRLPYLKLAIETVRRQDSGDWEIVVSDNDSSDDVAGHVASLQDPRIHYARTPRLLPVTENWNAALAMSSGDYVLMLGDDDGVLPGYVTHMRTLIDRFQQPDLIYSGALLFTYPGVDPDCPAGFLAANTHGEFFGDAHDPFLLGREQALAAVRRSLDFHLAFNFNMQLSLVSRRLIEEMSPQGDFYQSAFPDFYASCAAMLCAQRTVADPGERVVIGVTPKSYGFFHLNQQESEGRAFLSGAGDGPAQMPGTNINEGWLKAMEALEANYGARFGLRVNRRRYRLVQASNVYTRHLHGAADADEVAALEASLPLGERLVLRAANRVARLVRLAIPQRLWTALTQRFVGQHPSDWDPWREEGRYADLLEVTQRAQPTP
jgi:glycosyltransferase involved in cell wall biosynthesis